MIEQGQASAAGGSRAARGQQHAKEREREGRQALQHVRQGAWDTSYTRGVPVWPPARAARGRWRRGEPAACQAAVRA